MSSDWLSGIAPARLTAPKLVLMPTTPLQAAGTRTDAPVSEPSAAKLTQAATLAADPLDEPPVTCTGFHGLQASPK